MGRRARFNIRNAKGERLFTHKAFNYSVQGSAADQMKMAQIGFRRAGIPVLVVVHDDSNFSLPQGEAGERRLRDVEEIMAEAIKLRVPSLAEVEVGDDWGDVSKPKK
jgi:DNA polymerase I-like protein with 3'-5' exonuclease and polymerase domains